MNQRTGTSGNSTDNASPRSQASRSPQPETPDPLAPPRSVEPKIDRDPLAKGSVRPNPSGDLDD